MAWETITLETEAIVPAPKANRSISFKWESTDLSFQITLKYQQRMFKWYLNCPKAKINNEFFGVESNMSNEIAKARAIEIIQRRLNGSELEPYIQLYKARRTLRAA